MSAALSNIRDDINRYIPGIKSENSDHGLERILLLLCGFAGHGKSALINSCMCVVKNEMYRNLAGAGQKYGGRTMERTSYNLTNAISMTDNRGFNKLKSKEILEVCAQLRHLRPIGDVEWDKDNLEETIRHIPESYKQPKEFIIPVIVHSCLNHLKGDEIELMETLVKKCQEITTIPPIVVITNVGPPNRRSGNGATISKRFGKMGCTQTICLENYTENKQTRSPEADNQFLQFLDVCMKEAEHAIRQRGNPDAQQIFAKHVADQLKEESKERKNAIRELEEKLTAAKKQQEEEKYTAKRELEEVQKKVSDLEESFKREAEKKWYQRCIVL